MNILRLLLVLLSLNSFGQFYPAPSHLIPKPIDFRKVSWGMTQKEVIAAELSGSVLFSSDERLNYTGIVVQGQPAELDYVFEKGQLVQAIIRFYANTRDAANWIDDYRRINTGLNKKYKKPVLDKPIYRKRSTMDQDYELTMGNLTLAAKWVSGKTIVVHEMSNQRGFKHLLFYTVSWYYDKQKKKTQATDDL